MHYDYVVTLKRENARKTDLVSFLLLVFSILSFSYAQIRNGDSKWPPVRSSFNGFMLIATAILLLGLAMNLYSLRKGRSMRFRYWLLAAGIFWLAMPYFQWVFLLFIFFAILEAQAKYPLEIGFGTGGIVINSLFKKKIPWMALQSVMLKESILTLDFRNNTLIQKEVLDDDSPDADEDEFNEYCRRKLVNLP